MAMLTNCLPVTWGGELQGRVTTAQFQNPLFAGDYADPTILRVGGDFYFTHFLSLCTGLNDLAFA